jgi:hypothetical protein
MVPDLEHLDIANGYDDPVHSVYLMDTLKQEILSGLHNLRPLKISAKEFDGNWSCALPKLSTLKLEWTLEQHQPNTL